jgi:hypothetical protein
MEFHRRFLTVHVHHLPGRTMECHAHVQLENLYSIRIKHIKSKIGRRLSANILSFAEIIASLTTECSAEIYQRSQEKN